MKDEEFFKAMKERKYLQEIKGIKKYIVTVRNEKIDSIRPTAAPKSAVKLIILCIVCVALLFGIFSATYRFTSRKKVVDHNISINIKSLDVQTNLEVLSISNTEVIVDNEDNKKNSSGIKAWTQYSGTGVFTVNLDACEFIIDRVRKVVIVRTPNVEVSNFTLEYGKTKQLLFMNDLFNDSYKVGADLAQQQFYLAYSKIHDTIITNPYYYDTARRSAMQIIGGLVKGLNSEIPDLQVFVEVGVI